MNEILVVSIRLTSISCTFSLIIIQGVNLLRASQSLIRQPLAEWDSNKSHSVMSFNIVRQVLCLWLDEVKKKEEEKKERKRRHLWAAIEAAHAKWITYLICVRCLCRLLDNNSNFNLYQNKEFSFRQFTVKTLAWFISSKKNTFSIIQPIDNIKTLICIICIYHTLK